MKKIAILLLILILFAVTNPTKEDFTAWLQEKMEAQTESPLVKGVITLFGKNIIENSTKTTNFVLFSIYDMTINNQRIIIVGILKNFIPIYKEENPPVSNKTEGYLTP